MHVAGSGSGDRWCTGSAGVMHDSSSVPEVLVAVGGMEDDWIGFLREPGMMLYHWHRCRNTRRGLKDPIAGLCFTQAGHFDYGEVHWTHGWSYWFVHM